MRQNDPVELNVHSLDAPTSLSETMHIFLFRLKLFKNLEIQRRSCGSKEQQEMPHPQIVMIKNCYPVVFFCEIILNLSVAKIF